MIIKRNLKSKMPSIKRCRVGESAGEDDEGSAKRKKRKVNNNSNGYYYPLNLLGEVAAGVIPAAGLFGGGKGFSASWCAQVSCCPGEGESKSKSGIGGVRERTRPPLVRTSRGRVQVLPSRFNDSIIDNWRKETKSGEIDSRVEEHRFKTPRISGEFEKKRSKEYKLGSGCRRLSALCEDEGEEAGSLGLNESFDFRKYSSSRGSLTSLHEQQRLGEDEKSLLVEIVGNEEPIEFKKEEQGSERKNRCHGAEDFVSGDIVWAKCGKKEPAWPAIVIDPMSQAPEQVLSAQVAGRVCVMFFGYSGNGKQRDYAWIKRGMMFPFIEYVDRFQGEANLNRTKSCEFQMAIEEAFLAEHGFNERLTEDINVAAGNSSYHEFISGGIQEAADLNPDLEYQSQEIFRKKKGLRSCESCGLSLPLKTTKKVSAPEDQFLCKPCARLIKLKHFCGICKKIWNHSDNESWVRCDGCKVWVHAECDKISSNLFKDLGGTDYYCPDCKAKFNFELSDSEKWEPKLKYSKNNGQVVLPDKITVVCSGVEGIYFPSLHLVVCKCGLCGTEKQALSEWERHTGSKARNWKISVRVKGSMLPLEQWVSI